ncbi:TetR/AcrR family transcriptional regulator [Psychrobacter sp. DAB_AL32B]|uniref:TetR/AcrR family transcriptional regulator n=1 Tax=Psychrobacter sp. DAB_AL32B TaxID=1028414 RepID=UPI001E634CAC|nr:TetR/AcrR family transcriptional regulator [Psychrobacter sp. DAB_AL32B]
MSHVTFQAVADAVGFTKGRVMHHFTTKDALIHSVFNDAVTKFESEIDGTIV